mgnify:CR=1 FL=1
MSPSPEGAGTGLPATLVYGLALESPTSEALYAATEAGPYRLDPGTDTWEYIGGSTAPLTTYWCVEAVPAAQVVRFGTYGGQDVGDIGLAPKVVRRVGLAEGGQPAIGARAHRPRESRSLRGQRAQCLQRRELGGQALDL